MIWKGSKVHLTKTSSVNIPYFSTYHLERGVIWHILWEQVCTNCVIALLWPPCANLKSVAADDLYPLDFLSRRPKSWQQWELVTSIPGESTQRTSPPYWAYTYNTLDDIRRSHQCQVLYFARRMRTALLCLVVLNNCWHIQSHSFKAYDTWQLFLIFVGPTFISKKSFYLVL